MFLSMFEYLRKTTWCFLPMFQFHEIRRGVFGYVPMFLSSDEVFLAMFRCLENPTCCFCQCSSVFEIRRGVFASVPMFKKSDVVFFDNVPVFRESDVVFLAMFQRLGNPTWCFWQCSDV